LCSLRSHPLACSLPPCKALIAAGADVNKEGLKGELKGLSPLMYCCLNGYTEAADALVDAGADGNAAVPLPDDYKNVTPLMWCCISGNLTAVRRLVAAGADVTVELPPGPTQRVAIPLLIAAQHGLLQYFPLLPPELAKISQAVFDEATKREGVVLEYLQQEEDRNANRGDIEYPHLHTVLAIPAEAVKNFIH
jgi:ankyrin repeat protein